MSSSLRETATPHGEAILAAARAMPAEKYGFCPTPAQRTFAQLVIHIVSDSRITCSAIAGVAPGPEDKLDVSDSKEILVGALQKRIAFCDSALAQVTDAKLADRVTYYDHPGLRVQALIGLVDDWSDHYGQQAIYLLNGILPPTAKRDQSAAASTQDSTATALDGQRDFDFESVPGRFTSSACCIRYPGVPSGRARKVIRTSYARSGMAARAWRSSRTIGPHDTSTD